MSNLSQTLLGRFPGLESDVPPAEDDLEIESPEEGVDDTGAQIDGENIVEGDLVEAADDSAEIEDADEEAEELEDTSDSLESFLVAAQYGKSKGGWTEGEAIAYGIGLDATLKRMGVNSSIILPSLESFNDQRERIESTAAVENKIKDALVAIWDAIKRAVNKVVTFVRKWYVKIADGASRLRKRAEAIRKKAESTTGSATEKKLATSTLAQLHISKSMPNAKTIAEGIKNAGVLVGSLTSSSLDQKYGKTLDGLVEIITKLAEKGGKGEISSAIDKVEKLKSAKIFEMELGLDFNNASEADSKSHSPQGIDGLSTTFKTSAVFPGDRRVGMFEFELADQKEKRALGRTFAAAMRVVSKVTVFEASNKKVEIDNTKEVAVLTPNEVVHICNEVIDFCKVVVDYKLGFETYDKKNAAALGKLDGIVRKSGNTDEDREAGEYVRGLAQGFGSIIRNRGTSITNAINLGMGISRNALVYSVQSLALYK